MAESELERFFRENFPIVRAKCARLLGESEDAADVAQEAFVRLWESKLGDAPPRVRVAWLYRTCTRMAIDRLRRRRLAVEVPSQGEDGPLEQTELEELVRTRQVLRALSADTPVPELEVVALCRVDGLTHAEVGEVTGRSERSVRRLLARFDERAARWRGSRS